MKKFLFILLMVICFTLATALDPYFTQIRANASNAGVLVALLGDSRRLFASQFFTMADVYFHSGFYPSIFDTARFNENGEDMKATAARNHADEAPDNDEHEDYRGRPLDWIDRFGRNFTPARHTHLSDLGHGKEAEMLPWLKLAAEMDPSQVETYVVAAYWLRASLQQPAEAEQFLRQGLRANPGNPEILLELGRVYHYNYHRDDMARNIWREAIRSWSAKDADARKADSGVADAAYGELVRLDRDQRNLPQELNDLEGLKKVSPTPQAIDAIINQVRAQLGAPH